MNEQGGVINIVVAVLILVFALLALMNPIAQLTDVAADKEASLNSTTRYARDINGSTVLMSDGGASLGDITMSLMYGLGLIFIIGLIIYIVRFGPDDPRRYQNQGGFQ